MIDDCPAEILMKSTTLENYNSEFTTAIWLVR